MEIVKKIKMLKQECEPVSSPEEGLELADTLISVLNEHSGGIGLAANQIGINKRVFVLRIPEQDQGVFRMNFVNPVITHREQPIFFKGEGCLSFPRDMVNTLRFNLIHIKDDLNPEPRELTGIWAVAAEHEADHLDGKTMFDRKFKDIRTNDPCPCGSERKFKKCCQKNAREVNPGEL